MRQNVVKNKRRIEFHWLEEKSKILELTLSNNNEQHGKLGLVFLSSFSQPKLTCIATDDEESEEEVQVVTPVVKPAAVIISKKSKYADEDASDDEVKVSRKFKAMIQVRKLMVMIYRTIGMLQMMKKN